MIIKIVLKIDIVSFLENRVALFGVWYLSFRKQKHKAKDILDKIAIFTLHFLGIFSLFYLKSIAFILCLIYRLSSGITKDKLDHWLNKK
ncbi:hypothetical protein HYW54_03330 [Candidatus Gottesmanbacteria bacterium]|nr:hypothetical protein [Candidatus Gottesmanbacteria bacterium]